MIEKVQFRNFKAYRSLDLELEPFTVLVGPNASGKTTVLEGLRMLATHVAPALIGRMTASWIPAELRSFGSTQPGALKFFGIWGGIRGEVHLRGSLIQGERHTPEQYVPVRGKWGGEDLSVTDGSVLSSRGYSTNEINRYDALGALLKATAILRFEPRKLAEASYSEIPVPEVVSDGAGLASTLAYLKLSHDELFAEIELALKRIVPSVRRIRIERAAVAQNSLRTIALDEQKTQVSERRTLWGNRIVLDMQGAKEVPADSAGEGTLMVLGLLTVLMGPPKPRLVLIDDIELSLHPTAQGKLIEVLRTIQKNDPELQIVATSHSPFILNYLKPEEVRMTFLAENGFARCEKLTAHPDFEKWKGLMSPGEFWSTVGESWMEKVPASPPHE
ncbi:AAA family ATPase [Corallococcus sp. BB11-1]|uniref:AAA family ATPase n=1 Tax=Corallococcus sp. BB11-1 TaxID=2996783 RepID=UPI00226E80EF|nr:ATP-binding protein [Corallococcus sp. BB11-1]MCY1030471.1 AAA family ATPase [Corallococcus sp. BB11-1]